MLTTLETPAAEFGRARRHLRTRLQLDLASCVRMSLVHAHDTRGTAHCTGGGALHIMGVAALGDAKPSDATDRTHQLHLGSSCSCLYCLYRHTFATATSPSALIRLF